MSVVGKVEESRNPRNLIIVCVGGSFPSCIVAENERVNVACQCHGNNATEQSNSIEHSEIQQRLCQSCSDLPLETRFSTLHRAKKIGEYHNLTALASKFPMKTWHPKHQLFFQPLLWASRSYCRDVVHCGRDGHGARCRCWDKTEPCTERGS